MGNKSSLGSNAGLSSSPQDPSYEEETEVRRCRSESFRGVLFPKRSVDNSNSGTASPATTGGDYSFLNSRRVITKSESLREPQMRGSVWKFRQKQRSAISTANSSGRNTPNVKETSTAPHSILKGLVVRKMVGPLASFNIEELHWEPEEGVLLEKSSGEDQSPEVERKPSPRISTTSADTFSSSLLPSFSTSELRTRSLRERRITNAAIATKMSFGKKAKASAVQFTTVQINAVRSIWTPLKTTKGLILVGAQIFHRLEFKAPVVRECIRGVPLECLGDYPSIDAFSKQHSKDITECLDRIIKNLENVEVTSEFLEEVGAKHARLYVYGFTQKFFNIFAEALIDCTLEWGDKSQRKDETRKAWAMIVSFLVEKLKAGFTEEKRRLFYSNSNLPQNKKPIQTSSSVT